MKLFSQHERSGSARLGRTAYLPPIAAIVAALLLVAGGACNTRYIPEQLEPGEPAPPIDVDNELAIQVERTTVAQTSAYTSRAQIIGLSLNRLGMLIQRVSLYQGDGIQELDLYQSEDGKPEDFLSLEMGDTLEFLELDSLPDGLYTHLRFSIAALRIVIPGKITDNTLDAGTSSADYEENIELTYYLQDVQTAYDSYNTPETIPAGSVQLRLLPPDPELEEPRDLGFIDAAQVFPDQTEIPIGTYAMELDDSIRVHDSMFGRFVLNVLLVMQENLQVTDENDNNRIDLSLDLSGEDVIVDMHENLGSFPGFSIDIREEVFEKIDFEQLGIIFE